MKTNLNICVDVELIQLMKDQKLNISGKINELLVDYLENPITSNINSKEAISKANQTIKEQKTIIQAITKEEEVKQAELEKAQKEQETAKQLEKEKKEKEKEKKNQIRKEGIKANPSYSEYKAGRKTEEETIRELYELGLFINPEELHEFLKEEE